MRSIYKLLALSLVIAAFMSCSSNAESSAKKEDSSATEENTPVENYTIDTEKSKVIWKGNMLGMYSHEGTLDFLSGTFSMKDGEPLNGEFKVDMTSITPTDDGYDPEAGKGPEVLVGHLSSDDFFNVSEFKTAGLTVNGGKMSLTVRDKTHPVELKDFNFKEQGDLAEVEGKLTFDRKKFNVSFDHPAKEMVLSDDIEVTVQLVAKKN
jgi:polyisoprenoid-binding protein YceI